MAGHAAGHGPHHAGHRTACGKHQHSATDDPSLWTIPQGEEATRRHIRESLKAGDVDPATGRRILNYHDPMVPGKNFEAPAKSPFMDMMLVPRYAGSDAADASSVTVSPRIQQNLGLRTAPVVEGSLVSEVTAVGNVAWNERERVELSSRAMGFVEKLHVKAALDRVAAGAPLAELYVPDWVAAQEEYLALARLSGDGTDALKDAARQRMRQAGMTPAHIQRVVASGVVQPRFTLTAPIAGIVSELMVREGATVMPGMTLMRLQGTRTVWAEGAVPESQAALLQPGARVRTTSPGAPGQTFEGQVQALLPEVDAVTRTIRARVRAGQPAGAAGTGHAGEHAAGPPQDRHHAAGAQRRSDSHRAAQRGDGGRGRRALPPGGGDRGPGGGWPDRDQRGASNGTARGALGPVPDRLRSQPARAGGAAQPGACAHAVQQRYTTDAVIDALSGDTVTLTHPPIPALKWPQMQMDFKLPPRAQQPRDLEAGDRLQIEFEMQDGDVPRITSLQRVAPEAGK